jgi:hypothetical protein
MSFIDEVKDTLVKTGTAMSWEDKFSASIEEQKALIKAGEAKSRKSWWKNGKMSPKIMGKTFLDGAIPCPTEKRALELLDGLGNFRTDTKLKSVLKVKVTEVQDRMSTARAAMKK